MVSLLSYSRVVGVWICILSGSLAIAGCEDSKDRSRAHYEKGLKFVEQNELVKAKLEFKNALKLDKDSMPALYALGRAESAERNYVSAVRIFLGVAETDVKHVEARTDLSRIFLMAAKLDEAKKYADQAYAIDPDNADVLAMKAAIALKNNSMVEAVKFVKAALKIDPNHTESLIVYSAERLRNSDPKGALSYLEKGIANDQNNIGLQFFKIKILETLNDKDGIENVLNKLTSLYPNVMEINNNLARWYLKSGRKKEAEQVVRNFFTRNPGDQKAGFNLIGFVNTQNGKEAAERELLSIIKTREASVPTLDYKLAYAQLIFAKGENDQAIDYVSKLIDGAGESDDSAKSRLFLARRFIGLGNVDKAMALTQNVLENDKKNVEGLLLRATVRTMENNYTSAIDDLRNALNEEPQSANILHAIASVYERNGKINLAEENLAKAVAIQEYGANGGMNLARFLLRYGKPLRAETILQSVLKKAPGNEPALKQLAAIRLNSGDWQGASEVASSLAQIGEQNRVLADRIRAQALAGQNDFDQSIGILRTSLANNPDDTSPLADLFRLYVRSKNYDAAEELMNSQLQKKGDEVSSYIRLGFLSRIQNKMAEAEAFFKTAVEKDKKGINGLYALGNFYSLAKRFEEAEKVVRLGVQRQENNLVIQLLLASILEQSGKIDETIDLYKSMYKIESRSLIVANNLASLLSDYRGDPESLAQAYEIAFNRFQNTKTPQFQDTLGWIQVLRGDFGEAVAVLRPAAEALPKFGVVQYHLGMAYKGLGKDKLALQTLKKAQSLMLDIDFKGKDAMLKSLDELSAKVAAIASED